MNYLHVNGREIELDEDGFIIDPEEWTEEVARVFAANEGISDLTDEHDQLPSEDIPADSGIYETY